MFIFSDSASHKTHTTQKQFTHTHNTANTLTDISRKALCQNVLVTTQALNKLQGYCHWTEDAVLVGVEGVRGHSHSRQGQTEVSVDTAVASDSNCYGVGQF